MKLTDVPSTTDFVEALSLAAPMFSGLSVSYAGLLALNCLDAGQSLDVPRLLYWGGMALAFWVTARTGVRD
jgi:hypothetical protein